MNVYTRQLTAVALSGVLAVVLMSELTARFNLASEAVGISAVAALVIGIGVTVVVHSRFEPGESD